MTTPRGSDQVRQLIEAFGGIPRELRKELRPRIRAAADPIATEMKRRASWSSRIPGAISIGTRLATTDIGVRLRSNADRAPHARPHENLGKPGTFRHPLFGNREKWVTGRARPFFFPAVIAHRDQVSEAAAEAIDQAARLSGWR